MVSETIRGWGGCHLCNHFLGIVRREQKLNNRANDSCFVALQASLYERAKMNIMSTEELLLTTWWTVSHIQAKLYTQSGLKKFGSPIGTTTR